jgi:hypothetical protein
VRKHKPIVLAHKAGPRPVHWRRLSHACIHWGPQDTPCHWSQHELQRSCHTALVLCCLRCHTFTVQKEFKPSSQHCSTSRAMVHPGDQEHATMLVHDQQLVWVSLAWPVWRAGSTAGCICTMAQTKPGTCLCKATYHSRTGRAQQLKLGWRMGLRLRRQRGPPATQAECCWAPQQTTSCQLRPCCMLLQVAGGGLSGCKHRALTGGAGIWSLRACDSPSAYICTQRSSLTHLHKQFIKMAATTHRGALFAVAALLVLASSGKLHAGVCTALIPGLIILYSEQCCVHAKSQVVWRLAMWAANGTCCSRTPQGPLRTPQGPLRTPQVPHRSVYPPA